MQRVASRMRTCALRLSLQIPITRFVLLHAANRAFPTLSLSVAHLAPTAMDSLCTFKACLHPAPIKCDSCSSRRLSSTSNVQSRRCFNFLDRTNYLKAGSSGQLWLTGFEDKSRNRSLSKVVKAGEAEATVQKETVKEEVKGNEKAVSGTEGKAAPAVAEAKEVKEEGGASGKYWVIRCTSEGEAKSQEIVPGDGLLVGAAPDVTGSAKAFVLDMPTISSSHARIYSKDRRSYRTTVQEYFVMDLGSTNGTYLNRSKMRPRTEVKLTEGDSLRFGEEDVTFIVESPA